MSNPVTQFQILAKNPDRAAEFYGRLFDWKISADNPLSYRTIDTGAGRGIQGGIWPCPPEGQSLVQLFVEVKDLAATIETATRLGGQVVLPPQTLPQGEQMAIILDPEGLPVGLFRPAE
ncbi:MAG: VOC family protein [Planctomycetales bacterium]